MAEIAGLVLGGIPIAIWALEKYAEPFEAHHRYRDSIETLQAKLIIQDQHLKRTLARLGMDNDSSTDELKECLDTRFPSISRGLMIIIQNMNCGIAKLRNDLDIPADGKLTTLPQKAQWEWRRIKHSFSIKKQNKLIDDLRRCNQDLVRSLEVTEIPFEDETRKVRDITCSFNHRRCDATRRYFGSLYRALRSGLICACSTPHQAAVYLDWQSYDSAENNSYNLAVSYGTTAISSEPFRRWRKLQITMTTPAKTRNLTPEVPTPLLSSNPSPQSTSSLQSKFVRFRLHSDSSTKPNPVLSPPVPTAPTTVSIDTSPAIASLCNSVCNEHIPWTLDGSLTDPDDQQNKNFCVGHNKTDFHEIVTTLPLKSLISSQETPNQQESPNLLLTAKQRYGIAASLAWSVLHLSGSPWIGEYWDQHQTSIFLEKGSGGRVVLSRHPYASSIFSTTPAREAAPANNFLHLIPNKVVFTLGILLIELCINKPLADIPTGDGEALETSLLDAYQTAIEKLDEVYRLAGDSYGYAAERCVKCSFQGQNLSKDFVSPNFRKQFHHTVVAPVQATYLAFPGSQENC